MAMFKRGTAKIAQTINPANAEDPQEYLSGYTEGLKTAGELETDLTGKSESYVGGYNAAVLAKVSSSTADEAVGD